MKVSPPSSTDISRHPREPQRGIFRIQRATWRNGSLRMDATSTNPHAILTAHVTSSEAVMFALTTLGGGRYESRRGRTTNRSQSVIRGESWTHVPALRAPPTPAASPSGANFGGSATAAT
jgi:hypothetical protein